jgi:fatty-acyl-CoA synthase
MHDGGDQPWDGKSVGEIQVRGPFITGSYHAVDPEKFTDDGWAAHRGCGVPGHALGFVKITDRTKDLIKSGGKWITVPWAWRMPSWLTPRRRKPR